MTLLSAFIEVIKIAVPLVAVLYVVKLMFQNFQDKEDKNFLAKLQKDTKKYSFPARIQAYERLVLLAERLEPSAMLSRLSMEASNADELKLMMILSIQNEFEHNLAQQIYVSAPVWNQYTKAKHQLLSIVNKVGAKVDKDASTQAFAQALFAELEHNPPTDLLIAKSALKEEVANYL